MEWLPSYMNSYPKAEATHLILLCFVLVNAVPVVGYLQTVLLMLPIFVITTFVQLIVERRILENQATLIPPDALAYVRKPNEYMTTSITNTLLIGGVFCCAHYLQ